jgi:hypothetical protein
MLWCSMPNLSNFERAISALHYDLEDSFLIEIVSNSQILDSEKFHKLFTVYQVARSLFHQPYLVLFPLLNHLCQ